MEKYILGAILLLGLLHVAISDGELRPEVAKYEAAIMAEMQKLKETGDSKKDNAISEAMDRVAHLKPADMEPTELIGMMGRVMQSTLGLSIKVQDPTQMAEDEAKKGKEDKKKKKQKKDKKKKRKGPSLSNAGEL